MHETRVIQRCLGCGTSALNVTSEQWTLFIYINRQYKHLMLLDLLQYTFVLF